MTLNLNHSCATETTFKFKSSGVQHNLMPNEFLELHTNVSIVPFPFKIREGSSRKQPFLF